MSGSSLDRMTRRTFVKTTAATVALLSVPGMVSKRALAATSGRQSIIRAAMQTNPPTLDPHMTTTTATQQIAIHIFEPLFTYASDYSRISPVLVESWTVSPDELTYTFRIRDNVRFHNGKRLTAEDAAASFNRIRRFSSISGYYNAVKDVTVVDSRTFRVSLSEPMHLIATMANPVTWQAIMPAEIAEKAQDNEIRGADLIGTGPFRLVEWRPDQYIILERFDQYAPVDEPPSGFAGRKIAQVDQVRFIPVREPASRIAGLETGDYDYGENLPIVSRTRLEAAPGINPQIVRPQWAPSWELNHTNPPMNNVKFRHAVLAALDMDLVMRTVAMNDPNFYRVQPSRFYPEQAAWHNSRGSEYYNQKNPDRAKQLLEEAGYGGEDIVILSNRDYDWMYRCTLAASPQLEAAGIKVRIEFSDWASQIGKALTLKGWHINQSGWSVTFDPVQLRASLQSGMQYAYGYSNPEMDAILTRVARNMTLEERSKVVEELQHLVYQDVPSIRFGDLFGLEGVSTRLEGYESWYVTPRFWNVAKA